MLNDFEVTLRSLAITAPERVAAFPDLPAAAEAALPGYEVSTWYGLFAPKNTPEIVQRMAGEGILASVQSGCCR
jgi:tripartite-type tricarboxylate transporter receptor subunit TctC